MEDHVAFCYVCAPIAERLIAKLQEKDLQAKRRLAATGVDKIVLPPPARTDEKFRGGRVIRIIADDPAPPGLAFTPHVPSSSSSSHDDFGMRKGPVLTKEDREQLEGAVLAAVKNG